MTSRKLLLEHCICFYACIVVLRMVYFCKDCCWVSFVKNSCELKIKIKCLASNSEWTWRSNDEEIKISQMASPGIFQYAWFSKHKCLDIIPIIKRQEKTRFFTPVSNTTCCWLSRNQRKINNSNNYGREAFNIYYQYYINK